MISSDAMMKISNLSCVNKKKQNVIRWVLTDCNYWCKTTAAVFLSTFWSFPCFSNSNLWQQLWEKEVVIFKKKYEQEREREKEGGKEDSPVYWLTVESDLLKWYHLSCWILEAVGSVCACVRVLHAAETWDQLLPYRVCLTLTGMWNCVRLKQANWQL